MNQLPPTKHKNIRAIWEDLYFISLPEMYLRTEEDIRSRGTMTTGDSNLDNALQKQYAQAYRTIDQMFELYRQGVAIYVVKYEDTEKIYNAIQNHLTSWFNYLCNGLNLYGAPFEDLLELDKFASIVYDKAKFVFDSDAINTLKGSFNTLGIDLNPTTFFMGKKRPRFSHSFKTEEEKMIESDDYKRALATRRGYEEDFLKVASRYDFKTKNEGRAALQSLTDIRFGNE